MIKNGWADIENDAYHAGEGISSSDLKLVLDCPWKYQNKTAMNQSPAMAKGSRVHEVRFGGSRPLVVAPDCDKRTKAGKAAWAEFIDANPIGDILSQSEYDEVMRISDAIDDHPEARELLRGIHEISGYYNHPYCGLLKIRPDCRQHGTIADLKTTAGGGAAPDKFVRTICNFQYHLSAAYYLDVANAIDETVANYTEWAWVVVETAAPYMVAVYRPDMAMLDKGREMYMDALDTVNRCKNRDEWPAYESATLSLPPWELR